MAGSKNQTGKDLAKSRERGERQDRDLDLLIPEQRANDQGHQGTP